MILHQDTDAFRALIQQIFEQYGYRMDIIEKDYYVTLMLMELSKKQKNGLRAYFKGGTAIYKILQDLKRFSEDIDITLNTQGLTKSGQQRYLRNASKEYSSLLFKSDIDNHQSTRTCSFNYDPIFDFDSSDSLQRFGTVKIEVTSFTISEPIETHIIAPLLYSLASDEFKEILSERYSVIPFSIETLSIERIFIDKIFAIENYLLKEKYFEASKHAYDIYNLSQLDRVKEFLNNPSRFSELEKIQRTEEASRLGSELSQLELNRFTQLDSIMNDERFRSTFVEMQNIYIFVEKDILTIDDLQSSFVIIWKILNKMGMPLK